MGQFVFAAAHDVFVFKWDDSVEDMHEDDAINADERARLVDGVLKLRFDDGLGTYPSDQTSQWNKLTNFITPAALARLNSSSGRVSSLADELPAGMSDVPERAWKRPRVVSRSRATMRAARDAPTPAVPTFGEWVATLKPRFTAIPTHMAPPDATPADITKHNLDKSYTLTQLLSAVYENGL